jgi:putative acetyltransferase
MLKIRKIEFKDNSAVKELVINTLAEFGAKGPGFASSDAELQDMFQSYQADNKAFYVVVKDQEVLGIGGLAPLDGEEHSGICELRKMYFDPQLRGQGIGKQMIDKCIAKAKEIGFHTMYLETIPEMTAAQGLYKSRGFEYLESPKGNTCHSACQVFMQKKLNK